MSDSILNSIKKLLGISSDYANFDQDIIIHINTVFMTLGQLGIGVDKKFRIEDDTATWSDFLSEDDDLESIKTYIYLRVRLLFDPPTSSAIIESINNTIRELEWRLNVQAEIN